MNTTTTTKEQPVTTTSLDIHYRFEELAIDLGDNLFASLTEDLNHFGYQDSNHDFTPAQIATFEKILVAYETEAGRS